MVHKHMQQALGHSSIAHRCYLAATAKSDVTLRGIMQSSMRFEETEGN